MIYHSLFGLSRLYANQITQIQEFCWSRSNKCSMFYVGETFNIQIWYFILTCIDERIAIYTNIHKNLLAHKYEKTCGTRKRQNDQIDQWPDKDDYITCVRIWWRMWHNERFCKPVYDFVHNISISGQNQGVGINFFCDKFQSINDRILHEVKRSKFLVT